MVHFQIGPPSYPEQTAVENSSKRAFYNIIQELINLGNVPVNNKSLLLL
jgi:hypothetical protein